MAVTRERVHEVAASTLAAESGCRPDDFSGDGVLLREIAPEPPDDARLRRFPRFVHSLSITTMGGAVIVSATPSWMPWLREATRGAGPEDLFGPRILGAVSERASRRSCSLHGPLLYGCAASRDWRAHEAPGGYGVRAGGADLLEALPGDDWPNAISPRASAQGRRIAVAAVATSRGEAAGVATATEDSDAMWQLGVDVAPRHRGRGVGAALVSRVTDSVLGMGRVPYYGTAPGNIASRRLARAAGFLPVWIAAFTTEASSGLSR